MEPRVLLHRAGRGLEHAIALGDIRLEEAVHEVLVAVGEDAGPTQFVEHLLEQLREDQLTVAQAEGLSGLLALAVRGHEVDPGQDDRPPLLRWQRIPVAAYFCANGRAPIVATMSVHPDDPRLRAMARLLDVIARLRAPDGCPWDREQTPATMAPHLLEEAFEAADAIRGGDESETREELGDVLMNVLMIAQMRSEVGSFDAGDVADAIADKLVRRHPHVFGDAKATDAREVLGRWEELKRAERRAGNRASGALAGVPAALPALLRAFRVGEKAARVGFDWPDRSGPRAKLDEEIGELDEAIAGGDPARIESELGDVLFSLCNLARHLGVEPETALRGTIDRFSARFGRIEAEFGERLAEVGLAELDAAWNRAKQS